MLIIRLQRIGKTHNPEYRLVVAEKRKHVSKNVHEVLGHYNPITKKLQLRNTDSVQKYLAFNVAMSPTAEAILKKNGFAKPKNEASKATKDTTTTTKTRKTTKKSVKAA